VEPLGDEFAQTARDWGKEEWGRRRGNVPDAVCSECSLILAQPALAGCCSFHMITFPSYEHDASIWPNFGCAQATCHTGPACLPSQMKVLSTQKKGAKNRRKRDVLPFKCLTYAALGLAIYHVKDFNGTVRGACRKAFAIVIQLRVVLERDVFSTLTSGVEPLTRTYDHVLMSSFYRYWV
jgi:hypothetical protein